MRTLASRLGSLLVSRPLLTCASVAVGFGLYSVYLGQDTNFDLENYHRYNPYALFHGRIWRDMAPAGFQSYFNPALDLPYYWMTEYGPAPLAGFVMGVWHGLMFLLLYLVCAAALREDLPSADPLRPRRIALKLAALGCLALTFLWGLGNCMGDDSSAVIVLASLAVLACAWPELARHQGTWPLVCAGGLAGISAGLKLTNAPYALALCLAFAATPATWWQRARRMLAFGAGALIGMMMSAGWWWALLWRRFGNPLFPQFSQWFPHPWARSMGSVDARFLPHGFWEYVLWPFVFTWHGARVGEPRLHQLLWPALYVLFFAAGIFHFRRQRRLEPDPASGAVFAPPSTGNGFASYVLAFAALSYLGWMTVFSLYRYVVPVEVLLPLVTWILLHRLLPAQRAVPIAKWILATSIAIGWVGAMQTWGHYGWTQRAFQVEVPRMTAPARDTVLIMEGPLAWLIPSFPPEIAVAGIAIFPEGPGYKSDVQALIAKRGGDVYAISRSKVNWRKNDIIQLNSTLRSLGLTEYSGFCRGLKSLLDTTRLHAAVVLSDSPRDGSTRCDVTVRADDDPDLGIENAKLLKKSDAELGAYGFGLDLATCTTFPAHIGQDFLPYQWCKVVAR